jgi:hypothetical protein
MRRFILVAALACAGCPLGGSSGPPDPDSCATPSTSGITMLAIGPGYDEAENKELSGAFMPYEAGSQPNLATGGQGFKMLPVRLLISGTNLPACISQVTSSCIDNDGQSCLQGSGGSIYANDSPVKTYADPMGRVTKPIYLVLGNFDGGEVVVTSTVGGLTKRVAVGYGGGDLGIPIDLAPRD